MYRLFKYVYISTIKHKQKHSKMSNTVKLSDLGFSEKTGLKKILKQEIEATDHDHAVEGGMIEALELLNRRGNEYTIDEAMKIIEQYTTSHDWCVHDNHKTDPDNFTGLEIHRALKKIEKQEKAMKILEDLKATETTSDQTEELKEDLPFDGDVATRIENAQSFSEIYQILTHILETTDIDVSSTIKKVNVIQSKIDKCEYADMKHVDFKQLLSDLANWARDAYADLDRVQELRSSVSTEEYNKMVIDALSSIAPDALAKAMGKVDVTLQGRS